MSYRDVVAPNLGEYRLKGVLRQHAGKEEGGRMKRATTKDTKRRERREGGQPRRAAPTGGAKGGREMALTLAPSRPRERVVPRKGAGIGGRGQGKALRS